MPCTNNPRALDRGLTQTVVPCVQPFVGIGADSTKSCGFSLRRLKDHAEAGAAVEADVELLWNAEMADESCLRHRFLRREPIPIDRSLARRGIDGEVAHAQGRQVLKEMGALRKGDQETFERCLHDDLSR